MRISIEESNAERESAARAIVKTIIGASLFAASAAIYEYVLSHNTGSLTPAYQAFLGVIAVALCIFIVASKQDYIARSTDTISYVFVGFSVFLLSLFAYSLFVAGSPETVTRHTTWVIAILIIPFLTVDRARARRLGAGLCGGTALLVVTHIVKSGANPLYDPGCADLIIFLFSLGAAYLMLDGFALFREAAIKFHARNDALEQTASAMRVAVEKAEAAQREAEKSIKLRETFLATMSHELRTPLNAIIGFSEIIKSDSLGDRAIDQYRSYASDIHQSGEHVLGLINQLLDYSRIQSGTFDLVMEPVCIEDVATQVHRMMVPIAEKKAVRLAKDWNSDIQSLVSADRQGLVQIALNLLGNAVKFTEPGGVVTLRIDHPKPDCATLSVIDTGPGIPAEKLRDVQKPFVRLKDATLASETGTGLGLAIVTTLSAAMGADFSLDSTPGEGTVGRVTLSQAVDATVFDEPTFTSKVSFT